MYFSLVIVIAFIFTISINSILTIFDKYFKLVCASVIVKNGIQSGKRTVSQFENGIATDVEIVNFDLEGNVDSGGEIDPFKDNLEPILKLERRRESVKGYVSDVNARKLEKKIGTSKLISRKI